MSLVTDFIRMVCESGCSQTGKIYMSDIVELPFKSKAQGKVIGFHWTTGGALCGRSHIVTVQMSNGTLKNVNVWKVRYVSGNEDISYKERHF